MDTNNVLEIRDLHVIYETDQSTVYAVNGVNLTVTKGKTLGLVGETGAGKTTTALSIMRLLPKRIGIIRQGSITLDGHNVMELTESDMRLIRGDTVSMIFQDPMTSLNPVITVGKQIRESLELHRNGRSDKEIDARVDEMLEMVGIPASRKNDYPHQFSGGMKQRVVIAIALACSPELLIADEPTTALDVTIQAQVLELMRKLKAELNTSTILITHDLGVVAEMCDKVAIMYCGMIMEYGTLRDVYKNPAHPYTQGLFDSLPDLDTEVPRLKPIPGMVPDPTELPAGCPFENRCARATERCKTECPKLRTLSGTHTVRCHNVEGGEQ